MNILWLSYYYLPHVGGGTWTTFNLTRELAARGHKINLIVPNIDYRLTVSGEAAASIHKRNSSRLSRVPGFKIPNPLGPLISVIPMLIKGAGFRGRVDVIVCQYHPHHLVMLVAVFLGKLLGKPVVARADDTFREMGVKPSMSVQLIKMLNTVNESLVKDTAAFLVVSSQTKKIFTSWMGKRCSPEVVGVSINGYDPADFATIPTRTEARSALNISLNDKVVLFVGRFSGEEYGVDSLLRAFKLILREEPSALLILLGDVPSNKLVRLLESLGIEARTRIYGPIPHAEVARFIAVSDVCVGPLMATTAIPLKVLEYLACGKPVITGKGSVATDFHPAFGLIEVSATPEDVSKAILKVLTDNDYIKKVGAEGPELVAQFTWERIAIDLEALLERTVQKEIGG